MVASAKLAGPSLRRKGLFTLPTTEKFLNDELPELQARTESQPSEPLTSDNAERLLVDTEPDAALMSRSLLAGDGDFSGASRRRAAETGKGKADQEESDWHAIPEARITPELQKDLRILENRKHLDMKRFYKSSGHKRGELPTRVQVGTVVEGAHEFYSGRIARRERHQTWIGELVADRVYFKRTKRRYLNIQEQKKPGKRFIDNNLPGTGGGGRRRRRRSYVS